MRQLALVLAFAALACDTPPIEGPPGPAGPAGPQGAVGPAGPPGGSTVKSGTRLKARVARSEDGASQFLGWWDSELGVVCQWNDVSNRCLPAYVFAKPDVFADDACTVHAAQFDGSVPYCQSRSAPGELSYYYNFGAGAATVYQLDDGVCVATELPLADGAEWRACGDRPAIPRESFALMPVVVED